MHIVAFADANAQLASQQQRHLEHAKPFTDWCNALCLVPSRPVGGHSFFPTYWVSEFDTIQNDYVLGTPGVCQDISRAYTIEDFAPAVAGLDHSPLVVPIKLLVGKTVVHRPRRRLPYHRRALNRVDVQAELTAKLEAIIVPPISVDQSTRCKIVSDEILHAITEVAPPEKRAPRKQWITDDTFEIIQDKIASFKCVTRLGRFVRRLIAGDAWASTPVE